MSEPPPFDMPIPVPRVERTPRWIRVRADGELHRDVAWTYPDPLPECPGVRDRICFFNERVDITIDGELQRRPFTPWSMDPAG